ncbi:hypothetical protein [Chitinimonas koreensis]|uniref:hypothetical protein n=1 Tax=Chitinimonas koreensis TaxID=356302 RepID=UPI00040E2513|nr:hypothetical protein [Chitinimonas koreensis]QNM95434.1 hypothetical protein H9L41_16395 [Chitinimonas koreensis]
MNPIRWSVGLGLALLAIGPAAAEEPVEAAQIDVTAHPVALLPYRKVYEAAKRVRDASGGQIAFALRLRAKDGTPPLSDVRISLASERETLPLPVRAGWIVVVPVDERIAAENGDFLLNRKKGTSQASVVLLPTVADDAWTVGRMRQVVASGQQVRAQVPWFLRLFAPDIHSVSVCGRAAGMAIVLLRGDVPEATVTADAKSRNDADETVYCKHFDGKDGFDEALRVQVPSGAEVLLL